MSVRVTDSQHVALRCSTSGVAFGPVFEDYDSAEAFVDWMRGQGHDDVRVFRDTDLVRFKDEWESRRDPDLSDTAMFGAGSS